MTLTSLRGPTPARRAAFDRSRHFEIADRAVPPPTGSEQPRPRKPHDEALVRRRRLEPHVLALELLPAIELDPARVRIHPPVPRERPLVLAMAPPVVQHVREPVAH